jgi:hypothetical protein
MREDVEIKMMDKTKSIVAIAIGLGFALLPTVVTAQNSEDKPEAGSSTARPASPFACDRLALDAGGSHSDGGAGGPPAG